MTHDDDWLADALETIEEMRTHGELLLGPAIVRPRLQRSLARDLDAMRRFGYTFAVTRDRAGRIVHVRLLEQ